MAREIAVRVGEHLERFIHQGVAGGRFRSESDVVETALLLLEERETRLSQLRALFDQSGPSNALARSGSSGDS